MGRGPRKERLLAWRTEYCSVGVEGCRERWGEVLGGKEGGEEGVVMVARK